jgi:hypothetical protein
VFKVQKPRNSDFFFFGLFCVSKYLNFYGKAELNIDKHFRHKVYNILTKKNIKPEFSINLSLGKIQFLDLASKNNFPLSTDFIAFILQYCKLSTSNGSLNILCFKFKKNLQQQILVGTSMYSQYQLQFLFKFILTRI